MVGETETVSVQEEVKEALVKLGIHNADDNIMSEYEIMITVSDVIKKLVLLIMKGSLSDYVFE